MGFKRNKRQGHSVVLTRLLKRETDAAPLACEEQNQEGGCDGRHKKTTARCEGLQKTVACPRRVASGYAGTKAEGPGGPGTPQTSSISHGGNHMAKGQQTDWRAEAGRQQNSPGRPQILRPAAV